MSKQITILLAEDDDNDVFLFDLALRRAEVASALIHVSDGEMAMDYFLGNGKFADRNTYPLPDMAVFDIKMPRVTGLELLAWLRGRPQWRLLPVMMLTSSGEERDIKLANQLTASAYVIKSPQIEDLSRELKRFCGFWLLSHLERNPGITEPQNVIAEQPRAWPEKFAPDSA